MMQCPHCHQLLPNDSDFCQYCGVNLSDIGRKVEVPLQQNGNGNVENRSRKKELSKQEESINQSFDSTKQKKTHYCGQCGGEIDSNSRKCKKCGKQHFRIKTALPILLLSILSLCLIGAIIVLFLNNRTAVSRINSLEQAINQKEDDIENLKNTVADLEKTNQKYETRISEQKKRINEIENNLEDTTEIVKDYDLICTALREENLGYAADNFRSSEKIIYVNENQKDRKFTLTAHWSQGGEVSVSYLPSYRTPTAEVSFDNDSWETSTKMTVVPKSKGVTAVMFENSVNDDFLFVVIIVGDE